MKARAWKRGLGRPMSPSCAEPHVPSARPEPDGVAQAWVGTRPGGNVSIRRATAQAQAVSKPENRENGLWKSGPAFLLPFCTVLEPFHINFLHALHHDIPFEARFAYKRASIFSFFLFMVSWFLVCLVLEKSYAELAANLLFFFFISERILMGEENRRSARNAKWRGRV